MSRSTAQKISPALRASLKSVVYPATARRLREVTTASSRTLEVGCGPGQYRFAINGTYVGIDLTLADYRGDLPRLPDTLGDAQALPFARGAFDLVFFSNTFHLLGDGERALLEAIRALRGGGHLIIFDYSQATLVRLRRAQANASLAAHVEVRACRNWVSLLSRAHLTDIVVRRDSSGFLTLLAERLLTRGLYFALIDRAPGGVVVEGRKPL